MSWTPTESEYDKQWKLIKSLPKIKEKKPCPKCLAKLKENKDEKDIVSSHRSVNPN